MANVREARKFGVEFEVGNEKTQQQIEDTIKKCSSREIVVNSSWAQTTNNNYWHVKFDRTCGPIGKVEHADGKTKYADHGWEVASFVAAGDNDLNHISQVAQSLSAICLPNVNCGFHIHCCVSDFTPAELGVLLSRWMKIEGMLCNLMPPHRVDNYFCKLISKSRKIAKSKKYEAEEVWNKLKPNQYSPHENRQKKVTLNTVNVAAALYYESTFHPFDPPVYLNLKKTVEFRMPEGTLDARAVRSWVKFFIQFIEISKKSKMPVDLSAIKSIKDFFVICGLSHSDVKDNKELFEAKLFLIERFFLYGDSEVKKQFEKGLF
jgi:hypothetical protein